MFGFAAAAMFVAAAGTVAQVGCDQRERCESDPLLIPIGAALAVGGIAFAHAASQAPAAEPAAPAIVSPARATRPPVAPTADSSIALPARATDERTHQLARQAASAAAHGRCTAARVTLRHVAERDGAYHAELTRLDVFAACL